MGVVQAGHAGCRAHDHDLEAAAGKSVLEWWSLRSHMRAVRYRFQILPPRDDVGGSSPLRLFLGVTGSSRDTDALFFFGVPPDDIPVAVPASPECHFRQRLP